MHPVAPKSRLGDVQAHELLGCGHGDLSLEDRVVGGCIGIVANLSDGNAWLQVEGSRQARVQDRDGRPRLQIGRYLHVDRDASFQGVLTEGKREIGRVIDGGRGQGRHRGVVGSRHGSGPINVVDVFQQVGHSVVLGSGRGISDERLSRIDIQRKGLLGVGPDTVTSSNRELIGSRAG